MDPFLFTVGAAAAGALAIRLISRSAQQQVAARRLEEAVAPLGLAVEIRPLAGMVRAAGEVDELGLEVRYHEPARRLLRREQDHDPTAWLTVEATLPAPLPPGFLVRRVGIGQSLALLMGAEDHPIADPQLDRMLRVGCDDPEAAREILDHPEVVDALYRALRHHMDVTIEDRSVKLREETRIAVHPGPAVEIGLQLAFAVGRAMSEPLEEAFTRLGLERRPIRGGSAATGTVEGVTVKVTLGEGEGEEGPRTVVHATVEPALPAGIRLRPRQPGGPARGVGTGNPVLDGVVELQASDVAVARDLLMDETLTGPLLEVLHAWPGAYVHPRGVVISHAGWLRGRLGDAVVAASELAGILSERAVEAAVSPEVTPFE